MTIDMYVPQLVVSHRYDNIHHRNWDMTAGLILDAAVAIMDFIVGISTATTKSVQRKVCARWSCPITLQAAQILLHNFNKTCRGD
jgi:hypothetical protein